MLTYERPNDIIERTNKGVGVSFCALEGIGEVVRTPAWNMTTKGGEACKDDEQENDNLESSQNVLEVDAVFRREPVHEQSKCDHADSDSSLVPTIDLRTRSVKQHLSCTVGRV